MVVVVSSPRQQQSLLFALLLLLKAHLSHTLQSSLINGPPRIPKSSSASGHFVVCPTRIQYGVAACANMGVKPVVLPNHRISHTHLLSSKNHQQELPRRRDKNRNPLQSLLLRLIQRVTNFAYRAASRFQSLSRRAQRLVVAQGIVLVLACGGLARTAYINHAPTSNGSPFSSRRPIEISYSSFLDLVEQQQNAKRLTSLRAKPSATPPVPLIDHVRIGNDRISYRLYRQPTSPPPLQEAPVSSLPSKGGSKRHLVRPSTQPNFVTVFTKKVAASPELVQLLRSHDVPFAAAPQPRSSVLALTVRSFMVTFYFLILWRLYRTVSGGGGVGGGGGQDVPGKLARTSELPLASFDDIQGIDESKQEVMELVDTLRYPEKYAILGARAPTGLLLEGPPGTGKTMLARATAASAGVPLLYCSGSDFVEMFVGRGAARVRKLFERAAKLAPCIIFIDELDALGKARDGGFGGGLGGLSRSNDEAEQTLNQLLACMDGLDSSRRICVLAATNRKDVLDPALVRPGRFDRIVKLRMPDAMGRERILRVHCQKLPGFREGSGVDPARMGALGRGRVVDLGAIAAVTDGFSGAELEYLVNEAAIRAVRRVSAALRDGTGAADITPHVDALDFEASLSAFYETRRPNRGAVNDLWKKMLQ